MCTVMIRIVTLQPSSKHLPWISTNWERKVSIWGYWFWNFMQSHHLSKIEMATLMHPYSCYKKWNKSFYRISQALQRWIHAFNDNSFKEQCGTQSWFPLSRKPSCNKHFPSCPLVWSFQIEPKGHKHRSFQHPTSLIGMEMLTKQSAFLVLA